MSKSILFLVIFNSFLTIHAQSTLISGRIIVDDTDEIYDLNGFLIENLNTNARVKANEKGLFSIKVNLNDELLFKQQGFQERTIKISETMMNKGFITIHLNIEIIELAETMISPLKKNFKDNIKVEKSKSDLILESMGVNEAFKFDMIKVHYAVEHLKKTGKAFTYENVLAMKDMFTSYAKAHKPDFKKNINQQVDDIELLLKIFSEYYFTNDLKISKERILDFMNYCYTKYNFRKLIQNKNYDEIARKLEDESSNYLQINKITISDKE